MKIKKLSFMILFLFSCGIFCSTGLGEVVYDNTPTATSTVFTTEVGDTVTLGGTERFMNSFTLGIIVGESDFGKTDDFRLRFYLPNAPSGYPGRLFWQSPPLTNVVLTQNVQLVTFDIPEVRVPNTFIWTAEHGTVSGFAMAGTPSVGSSPPYVWMNLTQRPYGNFMAKIEATSRSDAVLLGTADSSGWFGLGTDERHNMRCNMSAGGQSRIKGPAFAGLTEWDEGTFPSLQAEDYAEFVEVLTNGLNNTISLRGESTGISDTEDDIFDKSPGISEGYPDFYGCHISDITLVIRDIDIDHSTPGWTYFTWDVTWEIWGMEMEADFNKDGKVNFQDYPVVAEDWFESGSSLVGDMSGPSGIYDGYVDEYDLDVFCDYWLKDIEDPNTW